MGKIKLWVSYFLLLIICMNIFPTNCKAEYIQTDQVTISGEVTDGYYRNWRTLCQRSWNYPIHANRIDVHFSGKSGCSYYWRILINDNVYYEPGRKGSHTVKIDDIYIRSIEIQGDSTYQPSHTISAEAHITLGAHVAGEEAVSAAQNAESAANAAKSSADAAAGDADYIRNTQLPSIENKIANLETIVNNINNSIAADTTSPDVEWATVSGAYSTSGSSIDIIISASDNVSSNLEYSINGGAYAALPADGNVSAPITNSGPNAITVRVRDEAGNVGSKVKTIWKL